MDDIYFHIGYRKTATSWLQNEVFLKSKDLNYIAKSDDNYPEWLIKLHYAVEIYYRKNKENIKTRLNSLIKKNKINLISSEAFTNTGVIAEQALRIKDVAPKAKIIITLRDPIECLKSHYRHDLKEKTAIYPFKDYVDFKRTPFYIGKRERYYIPDYYYDEIIEFYSDLFGSSNVLVLKYEDLKKENEISKLENFLGVKLLDLVTHASSKKVNQGIAKDSLKNVLELNIKLKLKSNFNNIDKINITTEEVVDNKTIENIIENVSGKCYGYY